MKCYLFWYHAEDGPEELKATLDINLVTSLAESYDGGDWFLRTDSKMSIMEKLNRAIAVNEIGIFPLMCGWGGLHFQIIELMPNGEMNDANN